MHNKPELELSVNFLLFIFIRVTTLQLLKLEVDLRIMMFIYSDFDA